MFFSVLVLKNSHLEEVFNPHMKPVIEKITRRGGERPAIYCILHSLCTKRSLEVLSSSKWPEGAIPSGRLGLRPLVLGYRGENREKPGKSEFCSLAEIHFFRESSPKSVPEWIFEFGLFVALIRTYSSGAEQLRSWIGSLVANLCRVVSATTPS